MGCLWQRYITVWREQLWKESSYYPREKSVLYLSKLRNDVTSEAERWSQHACHWVWNLAGEYCPC
ncbi:hypothetical protein L798_00663 [Zootermopsis nevadensis]|uniref:Uncharacterized protein n=1 Tax=Zootermopsis nevadensis TaxID=136037 RepID=A0A067QXI4_ZOONE|nr:hypothetical protein L798_00663 [Zootermopsis nevadensis]